MSEMTSRAWTSGRIIRSMRLNGAFDDPAEDPFYSSLVDNWEKMLNSLSG